jgi:hypothetical protein
MDTIACPKCGQQVAFKEGRDGVIALCEPCGSTWVPRGTPRAAVASAAAPPRPQAVRDLGEGPSLWNQQKPVPPLGPGQARAGEALYVRCEPGNNCHCGGIARVEASRTEGSSQNDKFVRLVCDVGIRVIPATTPVVPVAKPAVEPDPRPLYQRPVTINPRRT